MYLVNTRWAVGGVKTGKLPPHRRLPRSGIGSAVVWWPCWDLLDEVDERTLRNAPFAPSLLGPYARICAPPSPVRPLPHGR